MSLVFKTDSLVESKVPIKKSNKEITLCVILESSIKNDSHVDKVIILKDDYTDEHLEKILTDWFDDLDLRWCSFSSEYDTTFAIKNLIKKIRLDHKKNRRIEY